MAEAKPISRARLATEVRALYGLFPGSEPAETASARIIDYWQAAVGEYPEPIVLAAFEERVKTETFRPVPAQIIETCEALLRPEAEALRRSAAARLELETFARLHRTHNEALLRSWSTERRTVLLAEAQAAGLLS